MMFQLCRASVFLYNERDMAMSNTTSWQALEVSGAAEALQTDPGSGLSGAEAARRLELYGANALREKPAEGWLSRLARQFASFLVVILVLAGILSYAIGERVDAAVILAIVVLNAILGVVQEGKAERALEALKKMSAPTARVWRDGVLQSIPARGLVPGDVVRLEAGDVVPADLRLSESVNLQVDEASLTGESVPVEKRADTLLPVETPLADRANLAYLGTVVTYGRGRGLVVGTGPATEIGRIAESLQEAENEETPLQQSLDRLGRWLGLACLAVCAIVGVVYFFHQMRLPVHPGWGVLFSETLMISVSLAVAAIPEGLPAVVTIVLALGMKRMVERQAIIRRLQAVETLGCVDVICTDKTGTLTRNEMTVRSILAGGCHYRVTGIGYSPEGELASLSGIVVRPGRDVVLEAVLRGALLCNDAALRQEADGSWRVLGDPTEGALLAAAAKAGLSSEAEAARHPRQAELPFDSARKMMTTFHSGFGSGLVAFTKGAPDLVLDRCLRLRTDSGDVPLDDARRDEIHRANAEFAAQALRVLAIACREHPGSLHEVLPKDESDLVFLGLVAMNDPPREEARAAIAVCRRAGITPVMITGDHLGTAVAIAKDLALLREGEGAMTGLEVQRLGDEELRAKVETTRVYARVSPDDKVRIVAALRENGHVASMTGDGVNDAMALKKADIGVAMGISGTDVAKGASDMVLADDNFASIVAAVEEGRIIYGNIRKFVFFLLSCNIGEILVVLVSQLLGWPLPLLAIHLLWLNLVTDSFPALALGAERGDPDIMERQPRPRREPIIDRGMVWRIAVQSLADMAAVLGAFWMAGALGAENGLERARTIAFSTLVTAELLRAYSCRSDRFSVLRIGLFSNRAMLAATAASFALLLSALYLPGAGPLFKTVPLDGADWGIVFGFALLPLLAGEAIKLISRRRG